MSGKLCTQNSEIKKKKKRKEQVSTFKFTDTLNHFHLQKHLQEPDDTDYVLSQIKSTSSGQDKSLARTLSWRVLCDSHFWLWFTLPTYWSSPYLYLLLALLHMKHLAERLDIEKEHPESIWERDWAEGWRMRAEKNSELTKDQGSVPEPLQDCVPPESQLVRFKPMQPADGSNS